MPNKFRVAALLRLSILPIILIASPDLFAQSTAIEPCEATPTPKSNAAKPANSPAKVDIKASRIIVDSTLANDEAVELMLRPYREKVTALSTVIGRLEGEMKKTGVGGGTMGNFATDAMLVEARKKFGKNVAVAILNAGGLRKNEIAEGQLRLSDIFELMPFENALIALDVTGAQLVKLLQLTTRDAHAGARVQYRWNEQNRTEVLGVKLVDAEDREIEIDSNSTYTITTIDYLYKLNSGGYALLQEGKNVRWLDTTIRDAVINYVKAESAAGRPIRARLDDRFVQIGPSPPK